MVFFWRNPDTVIIVYIVILILLLLFVISIKIQPGFADLIFHPIVNHDMLICAMAKVQTLLNYWISTVETKQVKDKWNTSTVEKRKALMAFDNEKLRG